MFVISVGVDPAGRPARLRGGVYGKVDYLGFACRAALAVVFFTASLSKVRSRAAFEGFAASFAPLPIIRSLPPRWVGRAASAVPAAEAIAVVLAVAVPSAKIACGYALLLLAAFSIAIVILLSRGERASCRCFGSTAVPLGWSHVVRNSLLAVPCVAGLVVPASAEPWSLTSLHPAGLTMALAGGGVLALFAVRFDDVVAVFR